MGIGESRSRAVARRQVASGELIASLPGPGQFTYYIDTSIFSKAHYSLDLFLQEASLNYCINHIRIHI
jgi:hypothetical protein